MSSSCPGRTLLLVVAAICLSADRPHAAEPELKSVFPLAVRAGESVEVTVSGANLESATGLYFTQPGITAERIEPSRFRVHAAENARPGSMDVRVVTKEGISAPRRFVIESLSSVVEREGSDMPLDAQLLELPGSVDGRLDRPADVDWYAFEGGSGQAVTISCQSASLDGSVMPALRVVGPDGRELAHSRAYQMEPQLQLELPESGIYRVRVCDRAFRRDDFSFYRLRITRDPEAAESVEATSVPSAIVSAAWDSVVEDPESVVELETDADGNLPEEARSLQLPVRIEGRFESPGDVDWFRFPATKGQSLEIDVLGQRLGQAMDVDVALHDASGKLLATIADKPAPKDLPARLPVASLDAAGAWTAPADGEYLLAVRDLYGGSVYGSDRKYLLRIGPPRPRVIVVALHPDEKTPRGFAVKRGAATQLQLVALREGGFAGPIRIRAESLRATMQENLLEGLRVADFVLPADQSTVTLDVQADGQATLGTASLHLMAEVDMDGQKRELPVVSLTLVRAAPPTLPRLCDDLLLQVVEP